MMFRWRLTQESAGHLHMLPLGGIPSTDDRDLTILRQDRQLVFEQGTEVRAT